MILSLRLAWRRRRLRNEAVPGDGRPLWGEEARQLRLAERALADQAGTRRLAHFEEGAELHAASRNGGPRC
jgi:hypothetical protein